MEIAVRSHYDSEPERPFFDWYIGALPRILSSPAYKIALADSDQKLVASAAPRARLRTLINDPLYDLGCVLADLTGRTWDHLVSIQTTQMTLEMMHRVAFVEGLLHGMFIIGVKYEMLPQHMFVHFLAENDRRRYGKRYGAEFRAKFKN